jgi:signal transduction histidine kinase
MAGDQTVYLTMVDLPYRDAGGEIVGVVHVVEDVTEGGALRQQLTQHRNELRLLQQQLVRQNLELEAANAELRRLDELKTMFVSVAAHELRSPLTSIMGYLEVVIDNEVGPLNQQQLEYLQIVARSADHLLRVAKDLLDTTRIETGRIALVLRPEDLTALVEAVAAEHAPQLAARAQHFTLRAEPNLPPALCDATRASQIVGNLLDNASKYTRSGGSIVITVAVAEEDGFLQVSVADNGVGIPHGDQSKLFGRFFRAGTAADTGSSGAGLGLHITRSLVELHGGRIWFESALGQGSTFHVTFPVADSPD